MIISYINKNNSVRNGKTGAGNSVVNELSLHVIMIIYVIIMLLSFLMQFGLNYPFRCIYYHLLSLFLSSFVTFIINYINQ